MDLDKAISRLRNDFWFVGIVERFDEGLLILKKEFKKLGLSFNIMYVRQQIAPRTKQEKEQLVTNEIIEKIKKMNKLDQKLYEEANQIFEEKVKNYNGNIKADLQQFRRKLKVWRFYQQIVPGEIKRFSGYFRNINE
jgi:O6-methylguanine-DNA--protein-cysteine methyltransferase